MSKNTRLEESGDVEMNEVDEDYDTGKEEDNKKGYKSIAVPGAAGQLIN